MTWLAKFPRQAFELGAYTINALTGNVYMRFIGLRSAAERALELGDLVEAESLAKDMLRLAEQFKDDWHYGNAIHHGHRLLGLIALQREDLKGAQAHLLQSGRTNGSPQLNSFGPNMSLAKAYLEAGGDKETVLDYIDECSRFWRMPDSEISTTLIEQTLASWRETVEKGEVPDFGSNLHY